MRKKNGIRSFVSTWLGDESGAIAILMTLMLPAFVGMASLAVDASYVFSVHNQLQNAADAAALAGNQYIGTITTFTNSTPCTGSSAAPESSSTNSVCYYSEYVAGLNATGSVSGKILEASDIVLGTWSSAGTFTALAAGGTTPPNAVKVTIRMTSANGNAVNLFFTQMLSAIAKAAGFSQFSVTATAIAAYTATNACNAASCNNGSGFNSVSDLIVVQDVSESFFTCSGRACTPASTYAKAAIIDCIQDFANSGGSNSSFGITLFTGNSPQKQVTSIDGTAVPANYQGGWCPQNWYNSSANCPSGSWTTNSSGITFTAAQEQDPYIGLTAVGSTPADASNFETTMETGSDGKGGIDAADNATTGGCPNSFGSTNPQYGCSGSNIAAGMQSAINQFCPTAGCASGTVQMVIITDGIPNCESNSGSGNFGTSLVPGQGQSNITGTGNNNTAGACTTETAAGLPATTTSPTGTTQKWPTSDPSDSVLLLDAYDLAAYAGSLGITVSTIYYSGESAEGGGNTTGPDGLTHAQELQNLTVKANAALQTALGSNASVGQFFNEPTGTNLTEDMQEICAGGANANRPRLVY